MTAVHRLGFVLSVRDVLLHFLWFGFVKRSLVEVGDSLSPLLLRCSSILLPLVGN